MIWVTEDQTGNRISINPTYVVAVFTSSPVTNEDGSIDASNAGKTFIGLINGNLIVTETVDEIHELVNGAA